MSRKDETMRHLIAIAGCLASALLVSAPARAQAVDHAYTKIDLPACRHTRGRGPEDYGSWLCAGHAGIPVYISGGDQRVFVSFGANAKRELANRESLMSFSGEGKVVEWRIETLPNGRKRPFAAIMRWSTTVTADNGDIHRGQVLVVTRLGPGGVCHVGYVDGRANPDANDLARKVADERARTFRCGTDTPDSLGQTGPGFSPRLLMH
jgi:hypothetical protein